MIRDNLKDEFDHVLDELKEGVGPGGAYEPAVANANKHTKLALALVVVLVAVAVTVLRCHY